MNKHEVRTRSAKLNQFIRENGGNERDALVVALTRLDNANKTAELMAKEIEELRNEVEQQDELLKSLR